MTVRALLDRGGLELELVAGGEGLNRTLEYSRVQKSGLALAGFLQSVRPHRVQVFGKTELQYLRSLDDIEAEGALDAFFGTDVAAVVVTAGQELPPAIARAADEYAVPVLRANQDSSKVIAAVQEWLEESLSPEETVHGVMLDVFGIGVLLLGASGIGKSECALELVTKGHRLIADDAVRLVQRRNEVVASSLELTKHHMEIRGLGVINVLDLYGAASVRDRMKVELVVEMLDGSRKGEVDRLGLDEYTTEVLGAKVAKVTIPVRPGRNVSSIVEVAARNHLLKLQGHHSARAFDERLRAQLS
ncbi:MAG: HPr(Ser) kinase/phosphatase, partial [Myxococcota bacterium]